MTVRLEWDGKPERVEHVHLPFQTVETINESRATRERDTGALFGGDASQVAERNLLIWGDNKLVLSSLLAEFAGKVDLIYIDPPFATGADFSQRVSVGEIDLVKAPSILEEHAYRDTWGAGYDSYLTMLHERLVLMRDLLSPTGSIYLHLDWRAAPYGKLILDELFGVDGYLNEITWLRSASGKTTSRAFPRDTDTLLLFAKSENYTFNPVYMPLSKATRATYNMDDDDGRGKYCTVAMNKTGGPGPETTFDYVDNSGRVWPCPPKGWRMRESKIRALENDGRLYMAGSTVREKSYWNERTSEGKLASNLWNDIPNLQGASTEIVGYPTQKPEALLERIVKASSNEGDLVLDCFAGSGTTPVVAEKLGRRWIACDLGRFAIHTTRKRLLNITDCRPFDIKNLGAYERQRWQIESGNGALRAYLDTILAFYNAESMEGFAHLHGRKANRMVHIGATDSPVTIDETEKVIDEMADNGIEACDLLGWEWEMGLHDTISERARRRGLDLRPRQIPREVMERQLSEADAVRFFELAFVDLDVRRKGHEACVVLKEFAIPSEDLIPQKVRESIASWSDLIDYWSVDFDFSDEVFHNQWQAYRTRENPALATQSDWHEYPKTGSYAIVVKIIDIFGNDTTKLAEVRIK